MTISNTERASRSLPFPLEYPENEYFTAAPDAITQIAPNFFPEDENEKINVTFNLSLVEFVNLASAIDIGRDIGFGEQSAEVWYIWCRALLGAIAMSCEDIADCIETSEEVQNAITMNGDISLQLMMNNANNGLNGVPSVNATTDTINTIPQAIGAAKDDPVKELENCDLNKLWAGIRDGVVQRLDDNARSVLEWLVSKADVAERGTALIGAIPIFGSMAKAVLDQMVELSPDMLNLFEAYTSIEVLDEIACEIFGIVCSECRYPTYQEVFTYYASAGITGMDDLDDIVISVATDLLFGSTELAALAFYHTLIAYQLIVLAMGSKFYGASGSSALFTMASLGEDFANDNWMVLCDSCDDAYTLYTWDFVTQGQGEFYADTVDNASKPVFEPGKGFRAVNYSTGRRIDVCLKFEPTWEIRAVAFNIGGTTPGTQQWVRRPNWGSRTSESISSSGGGGGGYSRCFSGYASLTGYNEIVFYASGSANTNFWLERVAIVFNVGHGLPGQSTTDADPCT